MTEDKIEQGMLDTLAQMGWEIVNGPTIGPDGTMEREYTDVVLNRRLDIALSAIKPRYITEHREEAVRRIMRVSSAELLADNQDFHKLLVEGVDIERRAEDGGLRTVPVRLFDFDKRRKQ